MGSSASTVGRAQIVSLDEFRSSRRTRRRTLNILQPLVSIWFAAAGIAAAAAVWLLMSRVMRHGIVGLVVLLAVAAAIAWPAAGRYLAKPLSPARRDRDGGPPDARRAPR